MTISYVLVCLFAWISLVLAAPAQHDPRQEAACTNPRIRKPWHKLSAVEKRAYIDAELCLMKAPAKMGIRGAKTRFDELQSIHILQSEIRHFTGSFLPFHRLMIWAHEELLINDCGYTGAQVYWAQQLDAGNFLGSDVLNPKTGFGGNGVGAQRCIADGPFVDYKNTLGPGYSINEHCIDRSVSEKGSILASQANLDRCQATTSYVDFWNCIEGGGPHSAGHRGVGGEMLNPISSPGDPLFYLHHAWLDQLWWFWQKDDLSRRLTDMGGRNGASTGRGGAGGFGGGASGFFGFGRPDDVPAPVPQGDPGTTVTLSHQLSFYGVIPNITVADVMDITGRLCYDYEGP